MAVRGCNKCILISLACLAMCAAPTWALIKIGDTPALDFKSLDGTSVNLAAMRGKLVVVDFWVSSSARCLQAETKLVDMQTKYGEKGLKIVGVCFDRQQTDLQRALKELQVSWPQYWDGLGWKGRLVDDWGITTLNRDFLMGPDGAVLWIGHTTFLEREIVRALEEHPPHLVETPVLDRAGASLDAVEKALKEGDRAAAVRLFAQVPEDAKKDAAFSARYARTGKAVQKTSDALLHDADPMIDKKLYVDAAARLRELAKSVAGSSLELDLRKRLQDLMADPVAREQIESAQREGDASAALTAARALRGDQDLLAYPRFKAIVHDYAGTAAARAAAIAVTGYEADAEFMQRLHDESAAAKAHGALTLADNYAQAGKMDIARQRYADVIQQFPGTSFAEEAKRRLQELGQR